MSTADDHAAQAEIYDLFVRTTHDVPFLLAECRRAEGQVLELMAGTGRVAVPLLEQGVRLSCLDRSPAMLAVLRRKLQQKGLAAPIYEMDVCQMSLGKRFDLIFIALNSFSLLMTYAGQRQALYGIRQHLTAGGRFICTLHNPKVRLQKPLGELYLLFEHPIEEPAGSVFVWGRFAYEPQVKRIKGHDFVEIYDPAGRMMRKWVIGVEYTLHARDGFEELVETNGFRIEAMYGDYDRSAFDPETSPSMIYIMNKR